jgi:soluble lytic murein transglycosylase-like protein
MKRTGFVLLFVLVFLLGGSFGALYQDSLDKFLPKKVQYEAVSYTEYYIAFLRPDIDPELRSVIAKHVDINCSQLDLPVELVVSLIARESSFIPWNVSKENCVGLMQVHTKVHKKLLDRLLLKHSDMFVIEHNVKVGCLILKEYIGKSKTPEEALGRYIGEQGALTYKKDILSMTVQLYQRRIEN